MARITIIGAGRMGSALARAFAKAEHEVTVWNRTPSKSAALAGARISNASSLAQAVKDRDLVISVLINYAASAALFSEPAVVAELRNTTLLELASGTPKQAERAAAWAKDNAIAYLVGAMMVTPDRLGEPGCTFLYSGPHQLYEKHRATLAAVADNGTYVGAPIGHASALDNAILVVFWGAIHGALQGAAICRAEGFPLAGFTGALVAAWPVVQPSVVDVVTRIDAARYEADSSVAATIATCHGSMLHILEVCRDRGLDLKLPEAFKSVFSRAMDAGLGSHDTAAAFEMVAAPRH
jgi:3-hydroxyisobutyrate dehydrogenase-like beta-hydroxyacid dehydrogenase